MKLTTEIKNNLATINKGRKIDLNDFFDNLYTSRNFPISKHAKNFTWSKQAIETYEKSALCIDKIRNDFYAQELKKLPNIDNQDLINKRLGQDTAFIDLKWQLTLASTFNPDLLDKKVKNALPKNYADYQSKITNLLKYPSQHIKLKRENTSININFAHDAIKLGVAAEFLNSMSSYMYYDKFLDPKAKIISDIETLNTLSDFNVGMNNIVESTKYKLALSFELSKETVKKSSTGRTSKNYFVGFLKSSSFVAEKSMLLISTLTLAGVAATIGFCTAGVAIGIAALVCSLAICFVKRRERHKLKEKENNYLNTKFAVFNIDLKDKEPVTNISKSVQKFLNSNNYGHFYTPVDRYELIESSRNYVQFVESENTKVKQTLHSLLPKSNKVEYKIPN